MEYPEHYTEEEQSASEPDFYGKWFSAASSEPEEDQKVLLHIIYQKFVDGGLEEFDLVVSGSRRRGCWIVGDPAILWDCDCNLQFCDDDVAHWMPLPEPPK